MNDFSLKSYDNVIMLLGKEAVTNQEKALIKFAIEDAENKIKNYCNLSEIPQGLETVLARLSVDLYRAERYGSEDMPRQVTSVKRGDISTSFADTSKNESVETDFLSKYTAQLNAFRKLRW